MIAHGPYSGEDFRESVLKPLFDKYTLVTIDLSGTMGYGSSFLDESFGEMGRNLGFAEIQRRLVLICNDDPTTVDLVWAKVSKACSAQS